MVINQSSGRMRLLKVALCVCEGRDWDPQLGVWITVNFLILDFFLDINKYISGIHMTSNEWSSIKVSKGLASLKWMIIIQVIYFDFINGTNVSLPEPLSSFLEGFPFWYKKNHFCRILKLYKVIKVNLHPIFLTV